jgi:hypothetical protein
MTEDQLFEWEVEPKYERAKPKEPVIVNRPPGYHLISSTKGVQGYHRSKVPEAAMAGHGSVVTLCGILGRRLDEYPEQVPLCEECERVHAVK